MAHIGDLDDTYDPYRAAREAVDDPRNDAPRVHHEGLGTLLVVVGLIVLLALLVLWVIPFS